MSHYAPLSNTQITARQLRDLLSEVPETELDNPLFFEGCCEGGCNIPAAGAGIRRHPDGSAAFILLRCQLSPKEVRQLQFRSLRDALFAAADGTLEAEVIIEGFNLGGEPRGSA